MSILLDNLFLKLCEYSFLMPVSVCTQKEFLIESKLNGFWGVLLLLLDLEIFIWEVKLSELFCLNFICVLLCINFKLF